MIKSKKGISGIITAMIMIALVIAAAGVVWNVVNNIVNQRLQEAGSCFDTFEKVSINGRYTCQNTTANELHVSIGVEDIELTGLLLSITDNEGNSKSFKLSDTPTSDSHLRLNTGSYEDPVTVPGKNSGLAYVVDTAGLGIGFPSLIQIAPVSGGKQCEVADTLGQIDNCQNLVF